MVELASGLDPADTLEADEAAAIGQALVRDQLADAEHPLEHGLLVLGVVHGQAQVDGFQQIGRLADQGDSDVHPPLEHMVDELEVARLEYVQRQHHSRQEHDVRQGKDRQRGQNLCRG